MPDLTDPPDWEKRNQDKGRDAFNQVGQGGRDNPQPGERRIPEPAKPEPVRKYEMPGPAGDSVRRQEAERAAVARAKQLQAAKAQEIEKQPERGRGNEGDQRQGKEALPSERDAAAVARAQKLAKEFNNVAQFKGHER